MCTVSIIPMARRPMLRLAAGGSTAGYRIVCNRDESRHRAPAGVPKWRAIERAGVPGARAIWPMDMEAGGTWIAAGQHGLSLCLLNLNLEPPPDLRSARGLKSRGLVIPSLMGASDAAAAAARLERMSLKAFAPFRLVLVDADGENVRVGEARWDRRQLDIAWHSNGPICFVSSGLGDSRVTGRLALFEEMVAGAGEVQSDRQNEFHRHCWPDRPEVSVLMCRSDARTVSLTTIEAFRDGLGLWDVGMEYEAVAEPAEVVVNAGIRRAAGAY